MAEKKSVQYSVIDAFTDCPFKGNPAAVCRLDVCMMDVFKETWMQAVAEEFNLDTCFLTQIFSGTFFDPVPKFTLRWFTPLVELNLCGHGTLAASHFLFTSGLVISNKIEFLTKSGILSVEKVGGPKQLDASRPSMKKAGEHFSIEMNFPTISVIDCDPTEIPNIPETLNGASMLDVKKSTDGDLIVELLSGEAVVGLTPQFDELRKCAGRGVIITGPAPHGSEFDYFCRVFLPKLGVNEDPVTGSAQCALAPYWSKKLGKNHLIAYQASPRGGKLDLRLEENAQRVFIRGEAVTVMTGTLLV